MTQGEKEIQASIRLQEKERAVWQTQELRKYCLDRALGMYNPADPFTYPKGGAVKIAEVLYQYVKNGKIPKEIKVKPVKVPKFKKPFKKARNLMEAIANHEQ